MKDRWSEGIWLGCDVRSGEHLIGMTDGVFRSSTVRSKTSDTRWSPDRIATIGGTPAQPVPGQSSSRSPAFTRRHGQAPQAHAEYAPQNVEPATTRSWKTYKSHISKCGATPGCAGCKAIQSNTPSQNTTFSVGCELNMPYRKLRKAKSG